MDRRFPHLDTTSVSRPGASVPASDAPALHLTHGDAKDHRPALQQAVWALRVSQDGGLPWVSQRGDGTPSDPQMVQPRAEALRRACQDTPRPRYLVAAAQRACAAHAPPLAKLGWIPRIPATLQVGF